jgi:hypothetical protein
VGLTTPAQRKALQEAASRRTSAFATVTVPANVYTTTTSTSKTTLDLDALRRVYDGWREEDEKKSTPSSTKVDVNLRGKGWEAKGYYYQVSLDFAIGINTSSGDRWIPRPVKNVPKPPLTDEEKENWGLGYSNPLVNPKNWCEYFVRCQILQPTRDLLIGGFSLLWVAPPGWSFVDGQPLKMLVEVTSNPLVIIRKVMSPKTGEIPNNSTFRVSVLKVYP